MHDISKNLAVRPWAAAFGLLCMVIAACAPNDVVPDRLAKKIQPDCAAGFCQGSDPYPDSVGVYISSTINQASCINSDIYQDTDGDGLADICEQNLADTFNPSLRYCGCDLAWGGEPTYAAQPVQVTSGVWVIRIMYMPSYYNDAGDDRPCVGGLVTLCEGHYGDSEAILLDVIYNSNTQHWVLNSAYLSQHEGYMWYNGSSRAPFPETVGGYEMHEWYGANTLPVVAGQYPTAFSYNHPGGAPIIWVSPNKHANYADETECNNGGGWWLFAHDNCSSNASFTQMYLYDNNVGPRNVGSTGTRLMNCVSSYSPFYQPNNHPECYWTDDHFTGWTGINGSGQQTASPGYKVRLLDQWGF